jgi:hypothetical protein
VDLGAVSTDGHDSVWFAFALTRGTPQPVYVRIRLTAPLAAGTGVYLDEITLARGTQLYTGGPFVAAFSGRDGVAAGDSWTMTATNDQAGGLQTWFDRVFGMTEKGLLLTTEGVHSIPDSVIG